MNVVPTVPALNGGANSRIGSRGDLHLELCRAYGTPAAEDRAYPPP